MWLSVGIQTQPFDLGAEEAAVRAHAPDAGALVVFCGMVRAHDDAAQALAALHLEHYPGVTEAEITRIAQQAAQRWPLLACRVLHRVGPLAAGEGIVLVALAARHRQAAFDAAQYLMDYLKTQAPFWKREIFADGTARWVQPRDSDARAQQRWQQDDGTR